MINHVWVVVGEDTDGDTWVEFSDTTRSLARTVRNQVTKLYAQDGVKARFVVKKFTLNKETK